MALFFNGLAGLAAWPGLLVVIGLAFVAMGADLSRHEADETLVRSIEDRPGRRRPPF